MEVDSKEVNHIGVYFWHRVGNGFLTLLSNIFTDLNLSDMETCYKAFKREIIQSIKIEENRLDSNQKSLQKYQKKITGFMSWYILLW